MERTTLLMGQYPFPWDLFFRLAVALPSGRGSLVDDAKTAVSRMHPAPIVVGNEHVPPEGSAVVAVNHYQHRGLWIGWPGAVITVAVAERRKTQPLMHWLVTGGLRWCQGAGRGPEVPFTGTIFRAVARIYQMAALPLGSSASRAAAVRAWFGWLEEGEVCGFFPEGLRGTSGGLRPPEPGFDALCRMLRRRGVPVIPCGVFERENVLHIRFGEPLMGDDVHAESVMQAIARMLPGELWGAYAVGAMG